MTRSQRAGFWTLLTALALSGAASLANQVIWQRMLKLHFGGAEASSSALIVLVFLAGIGFGAWLGGKRAARVVNPLRAFALLELAIAACALCIAFIGQLDLQQSTATLLRVASDHAVPLLVVYSTLSALVLFVPTTLMGITIPLASEAMQRQLRIEESENIGVLTAFNTFGAVAGSLLSAYWLLPFHGQSKALFVTFALNGVASLLSMLLANRKADAAVAPQIDASHWRVTVTRDGAGLMAGALALIFELVMFRALALGFTPKPHTFALGLASYLAFWSLGNYLASRIRIPTALPVAAILLCFMAFDPLQEWLRFAKFSMWQGALILAAPALFFGLLYGRLITSDNASFGRDVGRFCAWNTVGACVGVALFFAVFSRLPISKSTAVLLLGSLSLVPLVYHKLSVRLAWTVATVPMSLAVALALFFLQRSSFNNPRLAQIEFPSPNGLIEVRSNGALIWDGLWHSNLGVGNNYVGTPNWRLAITPLLAHVGTVENALVIGFGSGMTVHALSTAPEVKRIKFFEINTQIESLMRSFTHAINPLNDPRVIARFKEARSQLVLDPEQYDLITQQPTYLSQSGSAFLLSKEYFQLVRSRLKPNGIFTVYANAIDSEAQRRLIHNTLASVFNNVYVCHAGYMFLVSDGAMQQPIEGEHMFANTRLAADLLLANQLPAQDLRKMTGGQTDICTASNRPKTGQMVISDDWPLVEYPEIAERLVR